MTATRRSVTDGRLLGSNEVYVAEDVITGDEQSTLLHWAEDQYRRGGLLENPRDPGAHSTPFRSSSGDLTDLTNASAQRDGTGQTPVWVPAVDSAHADALPEEFWRIRLRMVELLGLDELEEDRYKGSFLSYIAPGAGIHRHRDAALTVGGEERLILRCNVLLKRPEVGGLPVVESREIDVPDRGMWGFYPTELFHSASLVGGSEYRGLLSFGFLVRPGDLWHRRFGVARAFAREFGLDDDPAARRAAVDQLRRGAAEQGLGALQRDVLAFVLSSEDSFNVLHAAESIGWPPSDVLETLQGLQRADVVESRSSTSFSRGRVMVF